MPAAPPGTETLSITRPDGSAITATVHYDPDTRAWDDPAVTVDGTGAAVLYVNPGSGPVAIPVQAGIPVTAAVVIASGAADRGTGGILLLPEPPPWM
jgi:hypothetical protein